jgi:hypothetical protein
VHGFGRDGVVFVPTQDSKAAEERSSISVGCVAFASSEELASDPSRFFSELKAALASVENITELRIENAADGQTGIQRIRDPFNREERFYAHPYNGLLYYRIFIPFKKQDELGFRCEDEAFEV